MQTLSIRRLTSAVVLAGGLFFGPRAQAQGTDSTSLTTLSGVYTADQAKKGAEVHGAACLSCHKTVEHTGPKFWETLVGKPIWDFFAYVKKEMPQDNPGSLGDSDYAAVVAYIFSLNAVPTGQTPMPSDSVSLMKIKVVAPAPPGSSTFHGIRK